MKKRITALFLAIITLSSAGCSSGSQSSSTGNIDDFIQNITEEDTTSPVTTAKTTTKKVTTSKPVTTTQPATEKPTEPPSVNVGSMPVLSITTEKTGPKALDFVKYPVASHVSKAIASWTPGYIIPDEPYYEACTISATGTDNKLQLDRVKAEVKVRGNWTTSYDKKPLRIKFEKKQNLLGLNDGAEFKNWVLLAEYKDYSMLRNKTALAISREILGKDGLYAADAELVEVYINGEYWGVYLLTEFQQVNHDRVDITEPDKNYTGTDIGYFLEYDGYYSNEDALHSFLPDYHGNAALVPYDGKDGSDQEIQCLNDGSDRYKSDAGITIKSKINSPEQREFIENYINGVYAIMYNAAYYGVSYTFTDDKKTIREAEDMSTEDAVRAVVDVDSLADTYILNELFCDADLYWSSFFMDVDFGKSGNGKLRFEAPWDFDSALGNKVGRIENGKGFYAANILSDVNDTYTTINPWLAVLMYEDWFQKLIKEKWTAAYEDGVFDRALVAIKNDKKVHKQAFANNYSLWKNNTPKSAVSQELCRAALYCSTEEEAADYLSKWLKTRIEFMNSQWHK